MMLESRLTELTRDLLGANLSVTREQARELAKLQIAQEHADKLNVQARGRERLQLVRENAPLLQAMKPVTRRVALHVTATLREAALLGPSVMDESEYSRLVAYVEAEAKALAEVHTLQPIKNHVVP